MRFNQTILVCCCYLLLNVLQAQTTIGGTIEHDGLTRSYTVYIPAVYNSDYPTPLVLNLHGYGSAGWQQEIYGDFRSIADTANFIIVHPEGTQDPTNAQFWNVNFLGFNSPVDDIGFLENLVDSIASEYNIDSSRVYSTGMSNGGFMSHLLACQSDKFAAVASVTGSFTFHMDTICSPVNPIPVMQIHGTEDDVVFYDGGGAFIHVDSVVSHWVNYNNCDPTPSIDTVPDLDPGDSTRTVHYTYNMGDNDVTVEFYKVIGGGHTWPGAPLEIGVTSYDFDASSEIWRFFRQYPSPFYIPSTVEKLEQTAGNLQLYPNPVKQNLTAQSAAILQQIIVMNAQGQLVLQQECNSNTSTIDVKYLPAGIYFLQTQDLEGNFETKTFVKE